MISKELFEAVTGWLDDTEDISHHKQKIGYKKCKYNVYELAHKCKEWADKQKDCFSIVSGKVPNNYYCCIEVRFAWLGTADYERYFRADTEPEAVFMACEWILEEQKKGME